MAGGNCCAFGGENPRSGDYCYNCYKGYMWKMDGLCGVSKFDGEMPGFALCRARGVGDRGWRVVGMLCAK